MKNALLLLSVWVGIIVAAYGMVYWDREVEQPLPISVLEPVDSAYADPDGRFSLVFPAAWALEETEALVLLSDPSGNLEVTVFAVEEAVPESALLLTLRIVDSDEEASGAFSVEEIAPAGAAERGVKITGPVNEDDASYGLAYLYEGETIVLLVRGDKRTLERHAGEIGRIEAGITIPAAEPAPAEEAPPIVEL